MNSGQASFSYDGDGSRVAKTVNGVTTRYLVDTNNPTGFAQVVDEITGNQVARTYTYGHSLVSQRQLINNQWQVSFYGYDGQGSVRLLTDVTGAITDTYTLAHRRPLEFGGTGRDPVWCINSIWVNANVRLQFRQDSPTHGIIEPNAKMPMPDYRNALAETQLFWTLVKQGLF